MAAPRTSATIGASTALELIVSANATPTAAYWTGAQLTNSWATLANPSNATNWSSVYGNSPVDPLQIPSGGTDVYFANSTASTGTSPVSATLDQAFTINSLTFLGHCGVSHIGGHVGRLYDQQRHRYKRVDHQCVGGRLLGGHWYRSQRWQRRRDHQHQRGPGRQPVVDQQLQQHPIGRNSLSTITSTGAGINLTVGGSGNTAIRASIQTGTGGLIVSGLTPTSTLTLIGASNYTGATSVNSGTLQLNGGGSPTLGGTAITVASSATLNVRGNSSIGTASAGSITINGGGSLSLKEYDVNTLTLLNTTVGTLAMGNGANYNVDINPGGASTGTPDTVDDTIVQTLTLSGNAVVSLNTSPAAWAAITWTMAPTSCSPMRAVRCSMASNSSLPVERPPSRLAAAGSIP